jgi:hypothetical protein
MAALTWRDVAAPEMDLRGMALAGQTVTNSFDKLGSMLMQHAEKQKKDATDGAIAELMTKGSPEEVAAFLKNGGASLGANVNMRDFMEAGRAYEGQRMQADLTNQQRLDIVDRVAQAPDVADYFSVMGDQNATPEAREAARQAVLDSRNAADYVNTGVGILGNTETRKEIGRAHLVSEADQALGRRLEQQRMAQQAAEHAQSLALQRAELADRQNARRESRNEDGAPTAIGTAAAKQFAQMDPASASTAFMKTPEFTGLRTNAARTKALDAFTQMLTPYQSLTASERMNGGGGPSIVGMTGTSASLGRDLAAQAAIAADEFRRANPGIAAVEKIPQFEKASATDAVDAVRKNTYEYMPGRFVDRLHAEGFSDPEILAATSTITPANGIRAVPGFIDGGGDQIRARLVEMRRTNPVAAANEVANRKRPYDRLAATLEGHVTAAERTSAATGSGGVVARRQAEAFEKAAQIAEELLKKREAERKKKQR